jgi:hypothetical protein
MNLGSAGLEVDDPGEASAAFGMKLRRKPAMPDRFALRGEKPTATDRRKAVAAALQATDQIAAAALQQITAKPETVKALLDPVADAIAEALTSTEGDEAAFGAAVAGLLERIPGLAGEMDTKPLEAAIADAWRAAELNGMEAHT